jgi:hypothetical protein
MSGTTEQYSSLHVPGDLRVDFIPYWDTVVVTVVNSQRRRAELDEEAVETLVGQLQQWLTNRGTPDHKDQVSVVCNKCRAQWYWDLHYGDLELDPIETVCSACAEEIKDLNHE